ncbi:MAG TPA: hypothetical protein PK413_01435 [Thermoanaerobaculia bacterium]|nr:hypothetical protein [Thermoanaerobaculia bacterium]
MPQPHPLAQLPPVEEEGDFYVGYYRQAPPSRARWVQRAVALLGLVACGLALLFAFAQAPSPPARFEASQLETFEGTLELRPHPTLWLASPSPGPAPAWSLLVAPGKHGAEALVAGLNGRAIRLQGRPIRREGGLMIEVEPGTVEPLPGPAATAPARRSLGRIELEGEIVDGKCYLGAMVPGEGKPHRGCAARCISGGAPPLLRVRAENGPAFQVLLMAEDGGPLGPEILPFVAEPVRVKGTLYRQGSRLVLALGGAIERL